MSKLFRILEKLSEKKVWYCFQSQNNDYYHISVISPKGVKKIKGYKDIKELEKWLGKMWGHLLKPAGIPLPPRIDR